MYEGVPELSPTGTAGGRSSSGTRSTILYTAPTAIRAFMKWGREHADQHDLSSLRLLGSVGEPINPEAWMWYREVIGGERCPIVDTWWQTETGMIMITPLPGVTTLKPGSATKPFSGVDAAIVDEHGQGGRPGRRRLAGPAASRGRRCCAGSTSDHDRYVETYWAKYPRHRTSRATARGSTRTATSGSWAASTT